MFGGDHHGSSGVECNNSSAAFLWPEVRDFEFEVVGLEHIKSRVRVSRQISVSKSLPKS
jgi:hypothetical protein